MYSESFWLTCESCDIIQRILSIPKLSWWISRKPQHIQSYSSRPAWLQPWPRKPWKQWKPSRTSRTWGISLRKSIGKMWLSEVLIFFQWSSLLIQWSHMVSESIRSYDSVPAKTSDRLGLTAEACREVTIFARHENVLTLFSKTWVCLPVFTFSKRIP